MPMTCQLAAGGDSYPKSVTEALNVAVDCTTGLRPDETITGTPTSVVSPSGLTLANIAVNAAALEIDGKTVAIGKAITFKATAGTAGVTYEVALWAATSASPAQSREIRNIKISVQADMTA